MTALRWVVSGGGRGIGEAVVRRAYVAGDRVLAFSRSDEAAVLAARLGPSVVGISADVRDRDSLERVSSTVQKHLGGVDVLVNNAGMHRGGRLEKLPRASWDDVLATNLTGVLDVLQVVFPYMAAGSSIVNVGSVSAFRGFPGDAAYCASKAGLAGLTRALAVEFAPRGIRINLVVPGFVRTDMTDRLSPRAHAMVESRIPLGRTAEPDEVAEVIQWISRSHYMTGSEVAVDGGLMAALGSAG